MEETTPYFVRLEDAETANKAGILPRSAIDFVGPTWILVSFTKAQRSAYTFPITDMCGQEKVEFVQNN